MTSGQGSFALNGKDSNGGNQNLQQVTDVGNQTTNPIVLGSTKNVVGELINDSFATINPVLWQNNGLIVSDGSGLVFSNFATPGNFTGNYINTVKLYPYEKNIYRFEVTPTSAAGGMGLGMTQTVSLFAGFLYIYFDFDENCIKLMSSGVTVINKTASFTTSSLNQKISIEIKRNAGSIEIFAENTITGETINGQFFNNWGSQGKPTLFSDFGTCKVHNFSINSYSNNFNFLSGCLFIGDSYTDGAGALPTSTKRFPTLAMSGTFETFEAMGVNAAKSGEGLQYLQEILPTIKPKFVFIAFGVNDSNQGVPVVTFSANITALINATIAAGSIPILCGVFPQINSNVTNYNTEVLNLSIANGLVFVDVFNLLRNTTTGINNIYNADGVHINNAGHLQVANQIKKTCTLMQQDLTNYLLDQIVTLQLNNIATGDNQDYYLVVDPSGIVKKIPSPIDNRDFLTNGGNNANGQPLTIGALDSVVLNFIANKIVRAALSFSGLSVNSFANATDTTAKTQVGTGYVANQGANGGESAFINLTKVGGTFSGTVLYHGYVKSLTSFQTFSSIGTQNWPIIIRTQEGNLIFGTFPGAGSPVQIAGDGSVNTGLLKSERYRVLTTIAKNAQPTVHPFCADSSGGDSEGQNAFFVRNTGNILIGQETDIASSRFTVFAVSFNSVKGSIPNPTMTEAQRVSIAAPAVGLHVYQTDNVEGVYVYKSTGWTFAY